MNSKLLTAVCLLLCWLGLPVQASQLVDFGQLSQRLQQAYDLRLSNPARCIEQVNSFGELYAQLQQESIDKRRIQYLMEEDSIPALQIKAICHYYLDQSDEALELLDQALAISQNNQRDVASARSLVLRSVINTELTQETETAAIELGRALQYLSNKDSESARRLRLYALLQQARLQTVSQQYGQAKTSLQQAEELANQVNSDTLRAIVEQHIGRYYQALKQPGLALNHFSNCIELAERSNRPDLLAEAAARISHIYHEQDQKERAISFANIAAQNFQQVNDLSNLSAALVHLASIHRDIGEYNLALVYFYNALDLQNKARDPYSWATIHLEMGRTYLYMNKLKLAQKHLRYASRTFQEQQYNRGILDVLLAQAELNSRQEDYKTSRLNYEQAIPLAEQLNSPELLAGVYLSLSEIFEQLNLTNSALESLHRYNDLQGEIAREAQAISQEQFLEQYQLIQRSKQVESLQQAVEQQKGEMKQQLMLLAVLLIISILMAYMLYYYNSKWQVARHQSRELSRDLLQHPRTGLDNWRKLVAQSPNEAATPFNQYLSLIQEQPPSPLGPDDSIYYALIDVPFMSRLCERVGTHQAFRIEQRLGQYLKEKLTQPNSIYHIRDNIFLCICPKDSGEMAQDFAERLIRCFEGFRNELVENSHHSLMHQRSEPLQFDSKVAIGIVGHPFLAKAPLAVDDRKLHDLAYLALFGAVELMHEEGRSSWLELHALNNSQAAFYQGDIWLLGQDAISKGLIRVNCSGDRQLIKWPDHPRSRPQPQEDEVDLQSPLY